MKFLTCRFRGAPVVPPTVPIVPPAVPIVPPAVHPAAVRYGGKTPRARKGTPLACPAREPCQVFQSGQ